MKKYSIIYELNNLKEDLRKLKDYLPQKNFHFNDFIGGCILDIVNNETNRIEGDIHICVPKSRSIEREYDEPFFCIEVKGDTKLEEVVYEFYKKNI